MKIILTLLLTVWLLSSCNSNTANKKNGIIENKNDSIKMNIEKPVFFPVTSYIKGQLYDITKKGINPLKYITVKNHTDSSWIKAEDLTAALREFLEPEIDSVNLVTLFTEKKFLDQTLDAFTFTYDPSGPLPDSIQLSHWDVYVDPKTSQVKRIYMVKNIAPNKILQLTWLSNKWCKIITIINNPDGSSTIEKEEKITWDF